MNFNSPASWFLFCIAWFLIFYVGFDKPLLHAVALGAAVAYVFMFVIAMAKFG